MMGMVVTCSVRRALGLNRCMAMIHVAQSQEA